MVTAHLLDVALQARWTPHMLAQNLPKLCQKPAGRPPGGIPLARPF